MTVVGEAANGEEAVALARDLAPDVIVMDLMMTGINGVEAARRIRANRTEAVAIALRKHLLKI